MKVVNIVHAIDTEGPLYEPLDATFERLAHVYQVTGIKSSRENLEKLKNKQIDLGGKEEEVATMLNGHLLNYNDTWDKIDDMLCNILSDDYRTKYNDSFENGWIFNWHCLDHVGYEINPRRRDMGYHNIFDHYQQIVKEFNISQETINWHFHPMSTYKEAHRCATSYVNSPELYQILCRKIIERNWFPSVFRAGFQSERPDSNWFLEQWIPFDISNMSVENIEDLNKNIDFKNGRSGDWRLATKEWEIYHPNHDNYQISGKCRRWIGRALNPLNRIGAMDQFEMDKAFKRANNELPTLVGLASHDFRDLRNEVDFVWQLIKISKKKYPEVKFRYCTSLEGFRNVIDIDYKKVKPIKLEINLEKSPKNDVPSLTINTIQGEVFGPQPFLAIETISRNFIHDNLDFSPEGNKWFYAFHSDTLPLSDVKKIGIATNDKVGNTFVEVLNVN
tara:strand:- start:39 stop:1379 length:1341 start_codon:yes stop_codon:yes gene_type:complete